MENLIIKPITEMENPGYKYNSNKIIFLAKDIVDLNPTPFVIHEIEDNSINDEFKEMCKTIPERHLYINKNQNPNKTNLLFSGENAYVPGNLILENDTKCVNTLKQVIINKISEVLNMYFHNNKWSIFFTNSWIQKYKDGSFLSPHNHSSSIDSTDINKKCFSLAYYIDDGNPDEKYSLNGCITFQAGSNIHHIRPRPGLLLIWESHLVHNVNPFYSKDKTERVMLSANITCKPNNV
jgi:hypothetical protein